MTLIVGAKVILAAFEDQPEEAGEILSIDRKSGTAVVSVPPGDDQDDGLREVPLEQLKETPHGS